MANAMTSIIFILFSTFSDVAIMATEFENLNMEEVSDTTPVLQKDISPDYKEQKKAIGYLLSRTQKCDDTR